MGYGSSLSLGHVASRLLDEFDLKFDERHGLMIAHLPGGVLVGCWI